LFFWFSGLAALSAEPLPGWRAAAGILFLGIAATVRIDGPVYALASVPLLGAGALGRIAGRPRAAAAGLAAALALLGIQAAFKFSAWRGEFLEYAGSGPWPEAAAGFLLGALRRIWSAGDYARWTGRIVAAFFYAGIAVGIVRPGGRWTLWALAVMLLLEQFCYGSGGPTTPLLLHRSIPAFAVQCLICGAAAGWLARIASGFQWGRAAAVLLAAVITAAVPAANAGFLSREFAFNSEFRLVNAARADAAEGNQKCPLVFVRSNTDLGFPNPETLLPGWTVFPCDENEITPAECVREASDQDCAYYLRTGACFRNAGSGAWWPPNRYCAEVESRLKLEKILEIPADMHQSYGESETVQRRALLGLYHLTVDVK
jgi:hypothetical protein